MKLIFSLLITFSFLGFLFNYILFDDHVEDCGCFEFKLSEAVIVETGVSIQRMIDSNGIEYIMYKPDIIFEYIIKGNKYTGKNYAQYKTFNREKSIVENYLENYEIGKLIKIKYDKNLPENSFIINEVNNKYKKYLNITYFSLLFIGTGGLILFNYRKKYRRMK